MNRRAAAVLGCLAVLALLTFFEFPGHTWLQQDTQIYIPMFERIWDPSALARDLIAVKPHLSFTIYDETAMALRWVTRLSFRVVLESEQIVFRFLELLGLYLLARAFAFSRSVAVLVAACVSLGATIVGPAVLTFEYEPVPRGFALGFLFLGIGLAARGRRILAGCAIAIGFMYHAPTAVPVIMVLVIIAIRRRDYRPLIPLACACVLLFIAVRFQVGATVGQPFFARIDPSWEKLERMRASYNWVSIWVDPLLWQYAILWALGLVAFRRINPPCGRLFSVALPIIGMLSVPASYLLTERLKWALMPQVQPARALLWVVVFAQFLSAAAGARAAQKRVWWEAILWFTLVFAIPMQGRLEQIPARRLLLAVGLAALATGALTMQKRRAAAAVLAAAVAVPYFAIPLIGRVQNYPRLHTAERRALADWARTRTPGDVMFLFPDAGRDLNPGLFRAQAVRSVYVDWKAGGQVNYFRTFAQDWWTRWQATMSGKDIAANLPRFRDLGIDYVVLKRADALLGRTPVYANDAYLVYSLHHE